jgi:hypothetical protein
MGRQVWTLDRPEEKTSELRTAGNPRGVVWEIRRKIKRASDSRESLDARAALPQNCSNRRLRCLAIHGNGTDVLQLAHQGAILPRGFSTGAYNKL